MTEPSLTRAIPGVAVVGAVILGVALGSGEIQRALILMVVLVVAAVSIRWPLAGLCLAIAAIPLEVAGRLLPGVEEITLAKTLLLVAAGSWVLRLMFVREHIRLPRNAWALIAFWLAALLGTVLGPYGMTLGGGASLVALTGQLIVVVMIYNLVRTQRDLESVLSAVLVGCAIVGAVGILDIVTGTSFLNTVNQQYLVDRVSGFSRITATFYDPNVLGGYLTFGILINLTVLSALRSGQKWRRPLLTALLGAQAVCLVYTFSRGAFIAALGGVLVLALTGHGSWRSRVGGVVAALVPGLLLFTSQIDALFRRFAAVDAGLGGRSVAIQAALAAFVQHPLLGYGPGNVWRAIGAVIGQPYAAHNLYTEVLLSGGLLGALLLGTFAVSLLHDVHRVRDTRLVPYARGVTAALIGVLLMGFSLHMLKANELWLTLAILACIVRLDLDSKKVPPAGEDRLAVTGSLGVIQWRPARSVRSLGSGTGLDRGSDWSGQ